MKIIYLVADLKYKINLTDKRQYEKNFKKGTKLAIQ